MAAGSRKVAEGPSVEERRRSWLDDAVLASLPSLGLVLLWAGQPPQLTRARLTPSRLATVAPAQRPKSIAIARRRGYWPSNGATLARRHGPSLMRDQPPVSGAELEETPRWTGQPS